MYFQKVTNNTVTRISTLVALPEEAIGNARPILQPASIQELRMRSIGYDDDDVYYAIG